MRFSYGAAHVAAPLGDFIVEGKQQKAVHATENPYQQYQRKNAQQPARGVGVGKDRADLVEVVL